MLNPGKSRYLSGKAAYKVLLMLIIIAAGFTDLYAQSGKVDIKIKISSLELCILLFCISSVIGAELINTSIEINVDLATSERNERAGQAKDIAAAAVLVVSLVSAIIGCIIFLPKIFG